MAKKGPNGSKCQKKAKICIFGAFKMIGENSEKRAKTGQKWPKWPNLSKKGEKEVKLTRENGEKRPALSAACLRTSPPSCRVGSNPPDVIFIKKGTNLIKKVQIRTFFSRNVPDFDNLVLLTSCHTLVVRAADRRIVPRHSAVQFVALTINDG